MAFMARAVASRPRFHPVRLPCIGSSDDAGNPISQKGVRATLNGSHWDSKCPNPAADRAGMLNSRIPESVPFRILISSTNSHFGTLHSVDSALSFSRHRRRLTRRNCPPQAPAAKSLLFFRPALDAQSYVPFRLFEASTLRLSPPTLPALSAFPVDFQFSCFQRFTNPSFRKSFVFSSIQNAGGVAPLRLFKNQFRFRA